jgi:hypothetical protein
MPKITLSKTPKFDALIATILEGLVPHSRECRDCKKEFQVESEDITFYRMLKVPPPTLCPDCRERSRLAFANYSNIYKRKCDVPGHTDTMVSLVAPVVPWKTYDFDTYYSDAWDPFSYAREVDTQKSFLDQFLTLFKEVPQPGVRRGPGCVNSDFSFYGRAMKECYYVFGATRSENVMFSSSIFDCKNILDSYHIMNVDTGYENINTSNCYKVKWAYFSSSCIESDFIYDCRNCQNCFGCVNLRNKSYCFFNQQLSKEEYRDRMASINLGSRKVYEEYKNKFWDFVKENPIRATRINKSQNVSGNDIDQSVNCHNCLQVDMSENLRYATFSIITVKDSMDVSYSGRAERAYYAQNFSGNSSDIKFSYAVKECHNCEYVMTCKNCTNCFGCIGISNTSFAIFNKRYTEEEYWPTLDAIKTQMLADGSYGEFFPMSFSPYPYNSSLAHIIYPMSESESWTRGLLWQADIDTDIAGMQTISSQDLPDNISDITEDIHNLVIIGEVSQKPFRVTPAEVSFYKRNQIPLPVDSPYQRIIDRYKILDNCKLYREHCFYCGKSIESAHRTADGYKPTCEECFLEKVI